MKNLMKTGILAGMMGALLLAPAYAADKVEKNDKLAAVAASAVSATDHYKVAEMYAERAERFEAKATRHEELADRYARVPAPGMAHKWPSMTNQTPRAQMKLADLARGEAKNAREKEMRHREIAQKLENAE